VKSVKAEMGVKKIGKLVNKDIFLFQTPAGLEHLKNRFVKHVRAKKEVVAKTDVISVVRKEVDSEGVVRLKEETFNYDQVKMIALKLYLFC
jgi:hypothetical protein